MACEVCNGDGLVAGPAERRDKWPFIILRSDRVVCSACRGSGRNSAEEAEWRANGEAYAARSK